MRTALVIATALTALVLATSGAAYGGTPPTWNPDPLRTNVYGPPDHHDVLPNQEFSGLVAGLTDYDTHIMPEYQDSDCFWEWCTDTITGGGTVTIQVYLGWTCEYTYVAPDFEGQWAGCALMRADDVTMRYNGRDIPAYVHTHFFSD